MSFDTPLLSAGSAFKSNCNGSAGNTILHQPTAKCDASNTLIDELSYPALYPHDNNSPNNTDRSIQQNQNNSNEPAYAALQPNINNSSLINSTRTLTGAQQQHSQQPQYDNVPGLEPLQNTPRSSNESTPSTGTLQQSMISSPSHIFVPWRLSPLTHHRQFGTNGYINSNNSQSRSTDSPLLLDRYTSSQSNTNCNNNITPLLQPKLESNASNENVSTIDIGSPSIMNSTTMSHVKRDSSFQSNSNVFGLSPRLIGRPGGIPHILNINQQHNNNNNNTTLSQSPELTQLHQQRNQLNNQRVYEFQPQPISQQQSHSQPTSTNPSPNPLTMRIQPIKKNSTLSQTNKLANTVMQANANVKPEQLQQWREMHSDKSPTIQNEDNISVNTQQQNNTVYTDNDHNVNTQNRLVKYGNGRVQPVNGPLDSYSRSSTPTKHGRDRSVKAAMRIVIDHKDNNIVLEVIEKTYIRPSCVDDPAVSPFKIRLVKITNKSTNKIDVYVHAADLGGVVERKSNISRLFGQFESPTEKLLMSVSGAHNHSIGQESNILTYQGVCEFFNQKKMKTQLHYKHWIKSEILPTMVNIGSSTTPGNATDILPPKDRVNDSDDDDEQRRKTKKKQKLTKIESQNNNNNMTTINMSNTNNYIVPSQSIQSIPVQPPPSLHYVQQSSFQSMPQVSAPYFPQPFLPQHQQSAVSINRNSPTVYPHALHAIPHQTSDYLQQQFAIPYAQSYLSQYPSGGVPPPSMPHHTFSAEDEYTQRTSSFQHQQSGNQLYYGSSPFAGPQYSQQQLLAMQSPLMQRY